MLYMPALVRLPSLLGTMRFRYLELQNTLEKLQTYFTIFFAAFGVARSTLTNSKTLVGTVTRVTFDLPESEELN